MTNEIIHFKKKEPLETFEKKVFVCVVDNKVVGNIVNFESNFELMPVMMPNWNLFVNILQSPNHKFIENSNPVVIGTIWNGEEFIAPIDEEQNSKTDIGVYIDVGNSCIYYENDMWPPVKDYSLYIINIIKDILSSINHTAVNIIVNGYKEPNFKNNNKIIRIGINFDQTIVSDEIQNLPNSPLQKIFFNEKNYTVKLEMESYFIPMNIIFEYSKPNIKNIELSGLYTSYFEKASYIAPCVYKNVTNPTIKSIDTLTLFADDTSSPRREQILVKINSIINEHKNINNCYGDELKTLMENTKILINIHQSDFENTFEEIRVLPALMQKVLVVSEISPLTELVPFGPLIIWATYDNIVQKTKEVLDNYETYYNQIFTQQNINLLNNLHSQNMININNKLNSFLQNQ